MKVQILKMTGEMETVQVEKQVEGGGTETVEIEQEIVELVQEAEYTEETKAQVIKAAQLRSAMLTRDTGFRHVVKTL